MAKSRPTKEAGTPVIVALVFFVLTTIGLGVFAYVLSSDQDAKDAEVKKAQDELKNARKGEKEAQQVAVVTRVWAGLADGTDLQDVTEVKEGDKAYQELKRLGDLARKRGLDAGKAAVDKFNESLAAYFKAAAVQGGQPPKFDASAISDGDLAFWAGELDDKRQLKPPTRTMLDLTARAFQARDLAYTKAQADQAAYDNMLALIKQTSDAYVKAKEEFAKKAVAMPADLANHMKSLEAASNKTMEDYRTNMAATRKEVGTLTDTIGDKEAAERGAKGSIKKLNTDIQSLQSRIPQDDPFQYDEPQGKVTNRPEKGVVEINLGSTVNVRPGLTFTVLPRDFPQKGRQSRMRQTRLPDDRGNYKNFEIFVPKATIEVTEVLGPDLSRARITSETADIRDAVLTGDLLYNSVWRKGHTDHIALVGIFDVNGDGTDDIKAVVRDLSNMGVKVDAYMNLNQKELKWVGALTDQTRYLVEGYTPTGGVGEANNEAKGKVIGAIAQGKSDARARGISVVNFRDFFGRIGYRVRQDVSEDRINQAAAPYLSGVGAVEAPPPGN